MYNLEALLKDAFTHEFEKELGTFPSEKELEKEFPFTKKHLLELKDTEGGSKKKRGRKFTGSVYLKRFAAVIICIVVIPAVIILTNEDIRESISISIFNTQSSGKIATGIQSKSNKTPTVKDIKPEYIPKGYILLSKTALNDHSYKHNYCNEQDEVISITISPYKTDISAEYEPISIGSELGYYTTDTAQKVKYLIFEYREFGIRISATDLSKEELIKIAQNIK